MPECRSCGRVLARPTPPRCLVCGAPTEADQVAAVRSSSRGRRTSGGVARHRERSLLIAGGVVLAGLVVLGSAGSSLAFVVGLFLLLLVLGLVYAAIALGVVSLGVVGFVGARMAYDEARRILDDYIRSQEQQTRADDAGRTRHDQQSSTDDATETGQHDGPPSGWDSNLFTDEARTGFCYQILGLTPEAAPSDVRNAYRTLSRQLHPDARVGADPASVRAGEQKLKQVTAAYTILKRAGRAL